MKSTGITAAHNNGWLLPLISSGCDPRVHSLQIDGYIAIAPFAIYRRMQDAQMDRPLPRSHHAGTLLDLIYGAVADPHTWPELLTPGSLRRAESPFTQPSSFDYTILAGVRRS